MDIVNTFGPTYQDLVVLGKAWSALANWLTGDEKTSASSQSSYEATGPHPNLVSPGAPMPVIARNLDTSCSQSFFPPENIELRYLSVWDGSPWECNYTEPPAGEPSAVVAGLRTVNESECKQTGIPYEAIEYRYGGTDARRYMHLPWCMNK